MAVRGAAREVLAWEEGNFSGAASVFTREMRNTWIWQMTIILCSAALFAGGGAWADDGRWHDSFDATMEAARESGRPVLVTFHSAGCGPCAQMQQVTLADERVTALIAQRFEAVSVSALKQPDLATRYLVAFYPTVKFLDAEGIPVHDRRGFVPPDEFLTVMRRALDAHSALKRAQRAAAEDPAGAGDLLAIARDFRAARQYRDAAEWAGRARDAAEADALVAEASFLLGAALTDAGEPGRARQPLTDALKHAEGTPWRWEARLKLGYVWLQRGEEDSGIGLLQTVHASEEAAPDLRSEAARLLRWWGVDVD